MNEQIIYTLISTVKCTICDGAYSINDIIIIGHQDNTWFLNILCPLCQKQAFVIALINKGKSVEIVSDLTITELLELTQTKAIDIDDILDIHNFLKDFNGNFVSLFNKKVTEI